MSMRILIAISLVILAAVLFLARQKIPGPILQRLADVCTIVAFILAAVVFVITVAPILAPTPTVKPSQLPPLPTPEEKIEIPGYGEEGVRWCAEFNGTHEIRYESGAYSPWPTDEGCDPKGCWKGVIFVYEDDPSPDDIFAGNSKGEPQNPTLQIGWNDWKRSPKEVEEISKGLERKDIELRKGDCLIFIAVDARDAYHFPAYNRGSVTVSVKLQ